MRGFQRIFTHLLDNRSRSLQTSYLTFYAHSLSLKSYTYQHGDLGFIQIKKQPISCTWMGCGQLMIVLSFVDVVESNKHFVWNHTCTRCISDSHKQLVKTKKISKGVSYNIQTKWRDSQFSLSRRLPSPSDEMVIQRCSNYIKTKPFPTREIGQ